MARANGGGPPLRIVPKAAPPRPRHFHVRISAARDREPIGRTRSLKLTEPELAELLEFVLRLEERRA